MQWRKHHQMASTLCALSALCVVCVPTLIWAGEQRPNVVLILIDDLCHYGVTAYGANRISERTGRFESHEFSTPNIDQLAQDGVRCDNAFVYPLCEATRIALMSGQYNSRNFLRCKSQHASDITFGDTFQRAGYATCVAGKWKQTRGSKEIPGKEYIFEFGWDEFCCFDVVGEGQRFINPNLVVNGEVKNYTGRKDVDPQTGRRWYGPDICNRYALDFIQRHQDQPFFLYYPMLLVHDEHKPTPNTVPKTAFDACDESIDFDDRSYFPDMLVYMDKLIGQVINKLTELKLRKKTLVVVMGDNGTKEPFTHILPDDTWYPGGKGGTKDNGLHVPLIFSWPGTVPQGNHGAQRTYDGLVDVTDVYPTIAEAAQAEIPNRRQIDGVSLWPQVTGAPGEARQVIYTWYNANQPATDLKTTLRYAFNKEFKRYAPHANFPDGRFFDLRIDPLELSGDREVTVRWGHVQHSGFALDNLDAEQQAAYERLGEVLDAHQHVPVTRVQISATAAQHAVGQTVQLEHRVFPPNATRQNVVWESSHPEVATVNKFGELTGHEPGETTITIYSWDDAMPVAANEPITYSRDGVRDSIGITIFAGR